MPKNLNNTLASEGCTRCWCGCKYWENDKCIDCHSSYHPDMDLDGER